VTRARGTQRSDTRGETSERSTNDSSTSNQSATTTQGGSRTRKQTLVPRIREREIIPSIQYDPLDDQKEVKASHVTQFATGTADVYVAGHGVSRVQFRLAADALGRTPRFEAKKVQQLRALIQARPEFATPEHLLERRSDFERRLIEHLRQLPIPHSPTSTLILPPPPDDPSITI
jgi:hypothetical protein